MVTKWRVTGAWKADGVDGEMIVDAPNQRAAEAKAAQRGMMVEQAIPAVEIAQPVAVEYRHPTPIPSSTPHPLGRPCPVCGKCLPPVKRAKGSAVVMVLLLLFWILPGVLYAIMMSGSEYRCAWCGAKIADA